MNLVTVKRNNIFDYNLKIKPFNGDVYSENYTYESYEWGDYRKSFSNEDWEKIIFYNLALFKYNCFYVHALSHYKEHSRFIKFKKYIHRKYMDCMYYKPISRSFFFNYITIYDNYELFKKRKNQLIFDIGVHTIEALLYANMTAKYYGINNYNVYNLYTIYRGNVDSYKKNFDILKNRYHKENINYDMGDKYILSTDYDNIIEQYINNKIDLIYLNYYHGRNITTKRFIIVSFVVIYIMFNILEKGGIFIFSDRDYNIFFTNFTHYGKIF